MGLSRVTLTGADDTVRPSDLLEITREYPFVEWGILVSRKQVGTPRFPSLPWLADLRKLQERDRECVSHILGCRPKMFYLSCHVCGGWVKDIVAGDFSILNDSFDLFQRIQLNFHAEPHLVDGKGADFFSKVMGFKGRQLIFQVDQVNNELFKSAIRVNDNCVPLFDGSHGAGKLPQVGDWSQASRWPTPESLGVHALSYGYAGGLGPDCLPGQLEEIAKAVGIDDVLPKDHDVWIDMETKLRNDKDEFDLDKCVAVLKSCKPYIESAQWGGL